MHMRQGGLHLTFAGLNGGRAITRAWHDNTASLRVKRSLPYTDDGPVQQQRRDRPDTMSTFSMTHSNGRPSAVTTSISPASGRSESSPHHDLTGPSLRCSFTACCAQTRRGKLARRSTTLAPS
jgi:hypothetical protein